MISPFFGKFKVTSPRAYRNLFGTAEFHKGLDLVGLDDTDVHAVADGVIDAVLFEQNGFGQYIRQKLPDGRRIYYAHLRADSVCVCAGEKIYAGQKLGVMGSTGKVTGAHTHIELRPAGYGSESLDIACFTGIPNTVGTYFYEKKKYSRDELVDSLILHGATTPENASNWEIMLSDEKKIKLPYLRTLLSRLLCIIDGKQKEAAK